MATGMKLKVKGLSSGGAFEHLSSNGLRSRQRTRTSRLPDGASTWSFPCSLGGKGLHISTLVVETGGEIDRRRFDGDLCTLPQDERSKFFQLAGS